MLTRFVRELPDHLTGNGAAWLVLSDLPERLGLRDTDMVPRLIAAAGLTVRSHTAGPAATARRGRAPDPLAPYRSQERIHLWTLGRGAGSAGQPVAPGWTGPT
ncbi:hypothetical protein [Pseudonocardia sp. GCM10023141]|uniref:hypothetical protein n=1 Tax=Pseudonocardia sp. GCM10023141 TaxID=3252653 RepID=UPI003622B55A